MIGLLFDRMGCPLSVAEAVTIAVFVLALVSAVGHLSEKDSN